MKTKIKTDMDNLNDDYFGEDEDDNFQPCDECDSPDACADYLECGIAKGLWRPNNML